MQISLQISLAPRIPKIGFLCSSIPTKLAT
jgi:hypothetical protein